MHTRKIYADPENPTTFTSNGSLTGEMFIDLPADKVSPPHPSSGTVRVNVPAANVRAFVLEALRDEMIAKLEAMDTRQLAAFFTGLPPR